MKQISEEVKSNAGICLILYDTSRSNHESGTGMGVAINVSSALVNKATLSNALEEIGPKLDEHLPWSSLSRYYSRYVCISIGAGACVGAPLCSIYGFKPTLH